MDFNRTFKRTSQKNLPVPQAFADYLSKSSPQGTRYIPDKNGLVTLVTTEGGVSFGGIRIELTDEQKKDMPSKYSTVDVLNYLYNSQQRGNIVFDKPGIILINNTEFPISKLKYNPYVDIIDREGEYYIEPPKFPKPFNLDISNGVYSKSLTMNRIPNRSIHVFAFESSQSEVLFLSYQIDAKTGKMSMSMNVRLKKAKRIQDAVESLAIYNGWFDGTITINGENPNFKASDLCGRKYDEDSLLFWEKVLAIEQRLGTSFAIPEGEIDNETTFDVEALYQSLVNNVPTIHGEMVESVSGDWEFTQDNPREKTGEPVLIEFNATSSFQVFGKKFDIPALVVIFNSVVTKIEKRGKTSKLILGDADESERRFTAIMYFANQNELMNYRKKEHSEIIAAFQNAKKPSEHIRKDAEVGDNK